MVRQPAVANRFYPGSPKELERTVKNFLPDNGINKKAAIAAISPHAGYIYSGELAGQTIGSTIIPGTVIILGPNHHGQGPPVAISTISWAMPQGLVPIDREITDLLLSTSSSIKADEKAHQLEHSLEVQVPFLQAMQPNLHIVPLAVSHISYALCEEVAAEIAGCIKKADRHILILASTDMSHFESRTNASAKDSLALKRVTSLDPEGLYNTVVSKRISMCGFIPVTITLLAAKLLGATKADLVNYTDSGATSGDTESGSRLCRSAHFIIQ